MADITTFPMQAAEQAVAGSLHPLVAATHVALDQARTCAIVKLPKATTRVALHLASLGQAALVGGASPEAFTTVYRCEWVRLKGINHFPTLVTAVGNLNQAVSACQPGYHQVEVPTLSVALKERVKAHVGVDRMPVMLGNSWRMWTDGVVLVIPGTPKQTAQLMRYQSTIASEELRKQLMSPLSRMHDWVVGLRLAPTPASVYVGSDWSDHGGKVIATQGRTIACFSVASLAILRGCGATAFQLADACAAPRPKGKTASEGRLLVGFRGREPVGFAMPIALPHHEDDWAAELDTRLSRWLRLGAVPL